MAKGVLANLAAEGIQMVASGLVDLASEAITAADSLTKFESTMDFAGFGAQEIDALTQSVQDYASKTVYDLETIANTTAQLGANGVKDFMALTEAAGNLNAVAGGNADTFKSVAMVLTQTAGAGKLTTENWNQLADAIPGASGVLQEAMKKNGAYTGDFRDAMAAGEITAEEFNQAIMELGFEEAAIEAAYKEGESKLKGNGRSVPALSAIKNPLRDGDTERPDDEAYANSYFINANSSAAPGIVDANCNPILERSEVYSGVYGRASISFYAFNSNGNKGIACGLNNLQKIRDGEPLGGKTRAEDDFATDDDDFLS